MRIRESTERLVHVHFSLCSVTVIIITILIQRDFRYINGKYITFNLTYLFRHNNIMITSWYNNIDAGLYTEVDPKSSFGNIGRTLHYNTVIYGKLAQFNYWITFHPKRYHYVTTTTTTIVIITRIHCSEYKLPYSIIKMNNIQENSSYCVTKWFPGNTSPLWNKELFAKEKGRVEGSGTHDHKLKYIFKIITHYYCSWIISVILFYSGCIARATEVTDARSVQSGLPTLRCP